MSLGSEIIFEFIGLKVTNTLIATLITDFILLLIVYSVRKNISLIPNKIQSAFEMMVDYFYGLTEQVSGKRVVSIFPWVMSFFLFILFGNLLGLIPGISSFGIYEEIHGKKELIPLIKATTSDFNTTFALALVSLIATHVLAIKYTGIKGYLQRYFSLNPIYLFVGILELISEFTKLLSLSFRLFGNIFAGEVVLATISSMVALIAPIPFLMLESVVALVQALVFSMLTMAFMSILTAPHVEGGDH